MTSALILILWGSLNATLCAPADDPIPSSLPSIAATQVETPEADGDAVERNRTLLTGNNTIEARRIGAEGLLSDGSDAALAALETLLTTGDDAAAQQAICEAISARSARPPSRLIGPVLGLLGNSRGDVGRAAGSALSRFDQEEVVPRLRDVLKKTGRVSNGKGAAIAALGTMGVSKSAVQLLIELAGDADADVVSASLKALERATATRFANAEAAARWWDANKELSIEQWLRLLNDRKERELRDAQTRIEGLANRLAEKSRAAYLQSADTRKTELLLSFLTDAEPTMRRLGLELTNSLITDRKPIPPEVAQRVRAAAADPVTDVRRGAIGIISDIRDNGDTEFLRSLLSKEADTNVRAAIVRALGRAGGVESLPDLEAVLKEPAEVIVSEAVQGLGLICERLDEGTETCERVAAAIEARFAELDSPSPTLVVAFLEAMARNGSKRFAPMFEKYMAAGNAAEVRQAAINAAATTGASSLVAKLAALVSDENVAVRLSAVRAVARVAQNDEQISALLSRVSEQHETVESVRNAAWDGYLNWWKKRPIDDRITAAKRLASDSSIVGPNRTLELLASIDSMLVQDAERKEQRADLLLLRGNMLMQVNRFGDAADVLWSAHGIAVEAHADTAVNAMRCAVRAGRSDLIGQIAVAVRIQNEAGDVPRDDVMAALATAASALVTAGQLDGAEAAIKAGKGTHSDRLSEATRQAFDGVSAAIASARKEQAQRQIAAWVDELATADKADAAQQGLIQSGAIAMEPICVKLEALVVRDAASTDQEKRLGMIAKTIHPAWSGIAEGADQSTRQAAVAALRNVMSGKAPTSPPAKPATQPSPVAESAATQPAGD